jgi:erythrocyte band 7 integral membrane protein
MREAADILNTQSAMQIRYLETLNGMAKAPHTKIVFLPSSGNNQPVDASQSVIYDLMSQRA